MPGSHPCKQGRGAIPAHRTTPAPRRPIVYSQSCTRTRHRRHASSRCAAPPVRVGVAQFWGAEGDRGTRMLDCSLCRASATHKHSKLWMSAELRIGDSFGLRCSDARSQNGTFAFAFIELICLGSTCQRRAAAVDERINSARRSQRREESRHESRAILRFSRDRDVRPALPCMEGRLNLDSGSFRRNCPRSLPWQGPSRTVSLWKSVWCIHRRVLCVSLPGWNRFTPGKVSGPRYRNVECLTVRRI
ncbi:hypothetical protein C8R45DRAFT_393057 [Mycena sanguinolenta]|nr:hypothetical protein C8R45DRAFT_393057 [Mycena sanguinolenta]